MHTGGTTHSMGWALARGARLVATVSQPASQEGIFKSLRVAVGVAGWAA